MASAFKPKSSRLIKAMVVASLSGAISDLGGDYIADTNIHPPADTPHAGWSEIQIITTTVLDAATKSNITGITGVSLPAGTRIQGMFSQIKLTSGSLVAYNATLPE